VAQYCLFNMVMYGCKLQTFRPKNNCGSVQKQLRPVMIYPPNIVNLLFHGFKLRLKKKAKLLKS